MHNISSLVLRHFDLSRHEADQALMTVALLSCFGVIAALSLMSMGVDLRAGLI